MNILFITADQMRFDYMGFMGRVPVHTPHLDELAATGAVHLNAYTVNPLCMPARCSWITGLYSHQHRVMNNAGSINHTMATIPRALKNIGYYTAIIGKVHFHEGMGIHLDYVQHASAIQDLGFDFTWLTSGKEIAIACEDHWTYHLRKRGLLDRYRENLRQRKGGQAFAPTELEDEDTVDGLTAVQAIHFLQEHGRSKPWFLWLSFCDPHPPFDPLERDAALYSGVPFPAPVGVGIADAGRWQRRQAAYAAVVTRLDRNIGRVIQALEELDLARDTLVVFTADHGEMLGDHGLVGKAYPYEGSIRIPFIARGPGSVRPGMYTDPVEITDIAAIFLAIAGVEEPSKALPQSPSRSLLDVWRGRSLRRRYAFVENGDQFHPAFYALVDGRSKYVFYPSDGWEFFFDLVADPGETNNLAPDRPGMCAQLRRDLLERLGSSPSPPAFHALAGLEI